MGVRVSDISDIRTLDSGSQPLLAPAFSVFQLDDMDLASAYAAPSGAFTGQPGGPTVMHLRQNYEALLTELKLKPNSDRLTPNDYFNLLVKMTAGGARDQAAALQRRLITDLKERNEAQNRRYEQDVIEYERQLAAWNATPGAARANATEPVLPVRPAPLTEYDDPVNKFWDYMEQLYPERSSAALDEFNSFCAKPGETIASLTQRILNLQVVLTQPEHMVVFKLLGALPKDLRYETKRQLIATGMDVKDWTARKVGEIAVRIDRTNTEERLWTMATKVEANPRTFAPNARGPDTRTCNICHKPGHLARDCRSRPRAANAAQHAPGGSPGQPVRQIGPCHRCDQMGHLANNCPTYRQSRNNGQTARREPGKPWCDHHNTNTHSTAECRAAKKDKPRNAHTATDMAPPPVHPMDAIPMPSRDEADLPSYEELLDMWKSQKASHGHGYAGTLVPRRASAMVGSCTASCAGQRTVSAPHSGLSRRGPEAQRLQGRRQNDMPLGYYPRAVIGPPIPAPNPEPDSAPTSGPAPAPAPEPVELVEPSAAVNRPRRASPTAPKAPERTLPLGFEELPPHDDKYQGHIIEPSKPAPALPTVPESTDEPVGDKSDAAIEPIHTDPAADTIAEIPTVEPPDNNIYNAANPRLAALLSGLPGSYHSDRSHGTYRSPRVDNSGPRPAMTINGQVLHNLVLDCGADGLLVGPQTAAKLKLAPDMIRKNAIQIRVATGQIVHMDETIEPVAVVLNPSTPDETTVWARVIIVHGDLPDTLVGMSVIGPPSIRADYYKQVVNYYVNWQEPHAREAQLRCSLPVDYFDLDMPGASRAYRPLAYSATGPSGSSGPGPRSSAPPLAGPSLTPGTPLPFSRLHQIPTPKLDAQYEVENARFRMWHYEKNLIPELTDLYDRSVRRLADPPPAPRPISVEAFQHLRPLDTSMIDLRGPLAKNGPGLVVLELFSGIMAATEALVRNGIKIQQVYACENDHKARVVAEKRLQTLSAIRPELLPTEAFAECHTHLPQDIRKILRAQIEGMPKPDLVIVGFPCQGFSRASTSPKGLRDPRTQLFTEALRVLHLIWRIHGPCGYIFENVDAVDHSHIDVREEYTGVVQAVLGKGFAFDAVAAGSYAHRYRRWWTNLVPGNLVAEMADRKFKRRPPGMQVQDILEPGHTAKNARHNLASGPHSVNVPGRPLKAFSTFVSVANSHAYRVGEHSMVLDHLRREVDPSALERERAMGFMDNTTLEPADRIKEADRKRLLGSTMDMHALCFLVGCIQVFQQAFFAD